MKKTGLIAVLAAALILVFTGCAQADTDNTAEATATDADTTAVQTAAEVEYDIQIAGSVSVTPIMNALSDMYMAANTDITMIVRERGDGAGLAYCAQGT
ncbi:MAG: hypothetical protein PHO15_11295, partial [Eubacteriales bacterium]|nr:hypothetical protein [Eubacteriales bacterium]